MAVHESWLPRRASARHTTGLITIPDIPATTSVTDRTEDDDTKSSSGPTRRQEQVTSVYHIGRVKDRGEPLSLTRKKGKNKRRGHHHMRVVDETD